MDLYSNRVNEKSKKNSEYWQILLKEIKKGHITKKEADIAFRKSKTKSAFKGGHILYDYLKKHDNTI